jgi:hypothetical protein
MSWYASYPKFVRSLDLIGKHLQLTMDPPEDTEVKGVYWLTVRCESEKRNYRIKVVGNAIQAMVQAMANGKMFTFAKTEKETFPHVEEC